MKEESHNPRIDPELEARIVALVLGEASDFERDELNRLIEERPELAMLKDQVKNIKGRSFCALAEGAMGPVEALLRLFEDEIKDHIKQGKCPFA